MDLLQDVASALERGGAEAHGRCIRYDVRAAAPNDVARALDARASESPDLWVPDSSAWLERIGGFEGEPGVVAPSLARSPVVVAGRDIAQPRSWREVLSRRDVTFEDPR